jgi:hypothetical protein
MRSLVGSILAIVLAFAAAPAAAVDVVDEARAFMQVYEKELQAGDRAAIAARYHRGGAYFMGNARKRFDTHEQLVALYAGPQWRPPTSFQWKDLSFEPLGPDAVVVLGGFLWGLPSGGVPIAYSYTGVLKRQDGVLRILVEDESRALPPTTAP